jgi:hypothetical protein
LIKKKKKEGAFKKEGFIEYRSLFKGKKVTGMIVLNQ